MRRFVLATVFVFCVLPAGAAVNWIKLDPFVIRTDRVDPIVLTVSITPAAASGRIDFFPSGTLPLTTSDGGATWTATLTPAQVLAGYAADDVNRNLFGTMSFFDAGANTVDGPRQLTIGVLDAAADTTPLTLVSNLRVNNNVAAMQKNPLANPTSTAAVQTIAQQFYGTFTDIYDFLNVVYVLPEYPDNRDHYGTKNDVQGIGVGLFNNDALYGSAGKLQGITRYPLASWFDLGESGSLHEIGHQWINFLGHPAVSGGVPHWPPSQMAHNLMGFSIPGSGAGGTYQWKYVQQANGTYQFQGETSRDDFNDVDLYLMGLLDAGSVVPQLVLNNPSQVHCNGCPTGPVTPFGASDIVAQHGPRVPSAATSQKSFRAATIIVTRDRAASYDELQWFALFAKRGSAVQSQQYSIGFGKGTAKPFALATRNLATLGTGLSSNNAYPVIRDIQPRSAPAGTSITILGSGFNSPLVVIGTQAATIVSQSATSLTVIVPAGAAGKLDVNVRQASGLAIWPVGFTRQ